MITVVKVRPGGRCGHEVHYIGRKWAGYGESVFHNPFHVGKDGDREEVLLKFAEYWYAPEQAWLRRKAFAMLAINDTLGCWCKPLDCHGDIIAGYVNWKYHQESQGGLFV